MVKLEYLKKIRVRWIILLILLSFVWIVMGNPGLGEWYSRSIYSWVSSMLSRFSCLFPFSVGDCFIYGSIAGLLGYLSFVIIKKRRLGRAFRHIVEYLAWVYISLVVLITLLLLWEKGQSRAGPKKNETAKLHQSMLGYQTKDVVPSLNLSPQASLYLALLSGVVAHVNS